MELLTKRLQIRRIRESDYLDIRKIWQDFGRSPYACFDMPHNTDREEVRRQMARWEHASLGTDHLFFAVCLPEKVVGFFSCNKREDSYEIGYCFHSEYQGKGYAKESFFSLLPLLQGLGICRLTARTALENIPSVAFLRSVGFQLMQTEEVSFYKDDHGQDIIFEGGIFSLSLMKPEMKQERIP